MSRLKVVKPSPQRRQTALYGVKVHVEISSFKKGVIDALQDDMEVAGWGVPISRLIKNGLTTLTYDLEVEA